MPLISGIEGRPDGGDQRLDSRHSLLGTCRFHFLDDTASDHYAIGNCGHGPGGILIAYSETDRKRQLPMA